MAKYTLQVATIVVKLWYTINISNNNVTSSSADISASAQSLYITWRDDLVNKVTSPTSLNSGLYFTSSNDSGKTFGEPIIVNENMDNATAPSITSHGTGVFVAWQDNVAGNREIYVSSSNDSGKTFGEPTGAITFDAFPYDYHPQTPQILSINDSIFVVCA